MPMKNTARYVREALHSVLDQDFDDLELIVVDNGSTDGSCRIVESIRDPRVRMFWIETPRCAVSWNAALEAATGDVLMSCDSDDLFAPARIRRQVAFLDAHPEFGAVCGAFSTMEASGRHVADLWTEAQRAEEITADLCAGCARTHLSAFAMRRAHVVALGGKRAFFETAEDVDLQYRLAGVCRIWFEPVGVYRYRLHDGSLTHTQSSARRKFFEAYARELAIQRASGRPDDLERGTPREPPPASGSAPDRSVIQVRGMLLSQAWRTHARGERLAAIQLGLRALARDPSSLVTWRNMVALLLKPGPERRA
jgi:glycosyltransferase involved in cell wall biosynthesis